MTDLAQRGDLAMNVPYPENARSDDSLETLLGELFDQERVDQSITAAFDQVERAKREWEATVDALPELICVVDHEGLLVRANRTVERWSLGLVQAVRGQELHRFMHPDCDQTCYLSTFLQFARQKAISGQHVEHEDFDAILRRHIHIRVWPVRRRTSDENQHLAVIVHDITRRKEIENALQRNNERLKVLNSINAAILAARSQEEIATVVLKHIRSLVPFRQAYVLLLEEDTELYRALAYADHNEIFEQPEISFPQSMFCAEVGSRNDELFMVGDLHKRGAKSRFENELLKDGAASYISVPLTAENTHIGMFIVAMRSLDGFEAVHIQTISEVTEVLTVAVRQSQLHRHLKQTNGELQELLKLKHEVLQDVSHELRSPLALILGFTELLRDEVLGPLTAEQSRALSILESKGDQLFFMVKRLLTLHAVDVDALDRRPVEFGRLLNEELQAWQVPAANSRIKLIANIKEDLPIIMADDNRLRQVVTNLLDNSFKYGSTGGEVEIRAWSADNRVYFTVSDQGTGIDKSKLDMIFDRFYQVQGSLPETRGGVGIGLALCKAIVDAHGGEIWAESGGERKGTTFYVSLPVDG